MGSYNSKYINEITSTFTALKELLKQLIKGVKKFAGMKALNKAFEALKEIAKDLQGEEKQAVEKIVKVHLTVHEATYKAETAVQKAKEIISSVKRLLNATNFSYQRRLEAAIKSYVKRMGSLLPCFEEAHKAFSDASFKMNEMQSSLNLIETWCQKKLKEVEGKKDTEVMKERGKAYGGATGATLTVGTIGIICAAVNFWNPLGWVTAGIVTGAAAGVAFGSAFAIAESLTVKDIKKIYNSGKNIIKEAQSKLKELENTAKEDAKYLLEKRQELVIIHAKAESSVADGNFYLELVDEIFFVSFTKVVEDLETVVDAYIAEMNKKEEEVNNKNTS